MSKRQVFTRPAEPQDMLQFVEFMKASRDINLFDPDVMNYKTTRVLATYDRSGVTMFMPYQTVIMMESLAPRPGLDPREEALALREMTKTLAYIAKSKDVEEIMFVCSDPHVIEFAKGHGFEVLPFTTMRLKLKALEGTNHEVD